MSQSTKGAGPQAGTSQGTEQSSKTEGAKPDAGTQESGKQEMKSETGKPENEKQEMGNRGNEQRSQPMQRARLAGGQAATEQACDAQQEDFQTLMDDVGCAVSQYCSRRPGVAALAVFGVGFFFGWKMKPW